MRTVGIIAEYNPFHTGHAYHLQQSKKAADADYCVVVMSPDFVQRGEPALFDKYTRTQMALLSGADLVLELPVCYATGSAEYFAQGAVSLLNGLGVVDALCFGSETADAALFEQTAHILNEEPEPYRTLLKEGLRNGLTFPGARAEALAAYIERSASALDHSASGNSAASDIPADFLAAPNNILGIEYCRAMQKLRSSITPLPIERKGNGFNSRELDGEYCSATAIRTAVGSFTHAARILSYIPQPCHELFTEASRHTVTSEDFLPYLVQKLLSDSDYSRILDISPDLADRIRNLRFDCIGKTYMEIITLLKTKQITEARIRRALLHLVLGITEESAEHFRTNEMTPFARVLGFRKESTVLLGEIKKRSSLPLLTKPAHAAKSLGKCGIQMWEQNISASHLYRAAAAQKYHLPFVTEYQKSPIILSRSEN